MFLYVACGVILVVTCNHALPSLARLEVQGVPIVSGNEETGSIALSVLDEMPSVYKSLDGEAIEEYVSEQVLTYDDDNGYYPGKRRKRAVGPIRRIGQSVSLGAKLLRGLWARRTLLKGAKFERRAGGINYFYKYGDAQQMINDFIAVVKPRVVYQSSSGEMIGEVGDRIISYHFALAGAEKLFIYMRKNNGKYGDPIDEDVITYRAA